MTPLLFSNDFRYTSIIDISAILERLVIIAAVHKCHLGVISFTTSKQFQILGKIFVTVRTILYTAASFLHFVAAAYSLTPAADSCDDRNRPLK